MIDAVTVHVSVSDRTATVQADGKVVLRVNSNTQVGETVVLFSECQGNERVQVVVLHRRVPIGLGLVDCILVLFVVGVVNDERAA